MASDEWGEPLEGTKVNRWKPSVIGDCLIGVVQEVKKGTYGFEATIKKDDGEVITTPGHAYLTSKVGMLKAGQRVKISVTGSKTSGKGIGFLYDVRVSKNMQLDNVPDPEKADPNNDELIKIHHELKDVVRFFDQGTIPEVNVMQACHGSLTLFSGLKDKGLIATCPGGYKVVM